MNFSIRSRFVTYSSCASVLNDFRRAHNLGKHLVHFINKVTVVYQTCSVIGAVPVNEFHCLFLGQVKTKGAKTGAELGKNETDQ